MNFWDKLWVILLLTLLMGACNLPGSVENLEPAVTATFEAVSALPSDTLPPPADTQVPSETPLPPTETSTDTPVPSDTPTEIPTDTPTHTLVPTDTPTPVPTATATPTIAPTYAILRGKVIPDRANCRYGPGAAYLYKYGLVGGQF